MIEAPRILLINNDEVAVASLREALIIEGGHSLSFENNIPAGLEAFKQYNFDIIILGFSTPDLTDSIRLVKELKKIDPACVIIAFLKEVNTGALKELSRLGIYDFITKPLNVEKINFLIRKGRELRALMLANQKLIQSLQEQNISLQKQNTLLAKRIEESTKNLSRLYEDLRSTYMRTIKVLAQAIDARDHYTHSHSESVAKYATAIAEEMRLTVHDIESIREACELHDLGKIGIEDSILTKPAELTPQEWEQIKRHPQIAAQILEPLTFLDNVIVLIRQHHEHYDGSGYPQGLRGEEILLGARIIHLADAYDSMTSERSYRKTPFTKEEAILEIKRNSGTQFCPKVAEAFLRIVDKL